MTSFRQIEANRCNALKSTGPRSEAGKRVSRRNAVRHGLTAETVIGTLEDADDYRHSRKPLPRILTLSRRLNASLCCD